MSGSEKNIIWFSIHTAKFEHNSSKFQGLLKHTPMALGHVAQLVTCLTADTCLTPDPEVASAISARSHTFMEIDHEIISTAILLTSPDTRRVVSYKQNYLHEVLVNH